VFLLTADRDVSLSMPRRCCVDAASMLRMIRRQPVWTGGNWAILAHKMKTVNQYHGGTGIPNVANNLNRKGHTGRKESLVCLLLYRGFAFYALYVVEAALHLELLTGVNVREFGGDREWARMGAKRGVCGGGCCVWHR
jgi:hypothetical protein